MSSPSAGNTKKLPRRPPEGARGGKVKGQGDARDTEVGGKKVIRRGTKTLPGNITKRTGGRTTTEQGICLNSEGDIMELSMFV